MFIYFYLCIIQPHTCPVAVLSAMLRQSIHVTLRYDYNVSTRKQGEGLSQAVTSKLKRIASQIMTSDVLASLQTCPVRLFSETGKSSYWSASCRCCQTTQERHPQMPLELENSSERTVKDREKVCNAYQRHPVWKVWVDPEEAMQENAALFPTLFWFYGSQPPPIKSEILNVGSPTLWGSNKPPWIHPEKQRYLGMHAGSGVANIVRS